MTNIETTMYTLGQIARAVYPNGNIPTKTLDALLSRPATGLGMLAQSLPARAMRRAPDRHVDYDKLVAQLPADLTNGPVPVANQGSFWTGWYHYMAALDRAGKWGTDQLARAGTLLYGDRWQSDLARALGVTDRTVRAWAAGDRNPSAGVWADIAGLLRQRQQEGSVLLHELEQW